MRDMAQLLGPWFVLLSFAALVVINGVTWLARRHKLLTSGTKRAQLNAEIAFLRREAAKLNTPNTYARCAKYQRLANAKEKELAELNAGPVVPDTADRLLMVGRAVKMLMLCSATLLAWEAPVTRLVPRSVGAPLSRLLAWPRGIELAGFGGVSLAPWLLLLDTATDALARAVLPPPGAVPGSSATGLGTLDVERLAKEVEATGRSRSMQQMAQLS